MAILLLGTTVGGFAAIHAGNIGSQSVNYANTSGSTTGNAATATYATTAGALSSMNISQFTNNSGYLTSVSDIWVNTTGDTMTGPLTVPYLNITEPVETFNPFGPFKMHDSILSNSMVGRWDRFDVTINGTLVPGASVNLSNQNFEEYNGNSLFGTDAGETKVFNINVQKLESGSINSNGITYCNGYFDICFYSSPFPASWSARVKNRDGNYTTVTSLIQIGSSKLRGIIPIGNWLTDIEFTLTARTSAPYVTGNITYGISEFELFFSRMAASQGGNISSIGGYLGGVITTSSGITSSNWNTAYSWGNHATAGYLTSYTETDTLQSVTNRGGTTTNRLEFQYSVDRYSQAWKNTSTGAYWWVTTDADKLGFHRNGDGDKFYFTNAGDFYSVTNGWLSTALATKQNAATAITTSNIASQSVSYANSAGTVTGSSTIGGYLTLATNWGVSPYTSAFTIIGSHPSMTFRGSNGDTHYLMHMDGAGDIQYYFGPGYTTNNWTQRYTFTKGGNFSALTGNISASGTITSGATISSGDSVTLLGELYWGGSSSGQKTRAYTTGSSGSATLNYSFWTGSAWSIVSTLTSGGAANFTGALTAYNLSGTNTGDQTLAGLGGVPTGRTITINGVAQDLSANRTFTVSGSDSTKLPLAGGTLTGPLIGTTIKARGAQTINNYTTAALWTESYDNTTTGIAFHISGVIGKYLEMRTDGILYWDNTQVVTNAGTWSINVTGSAGSATSATSATYLNSGNYIQQTGSQGSWNADFQNTPAGTAKYGGDVGANATNNPGGSWWIQQNFRHTNASNYWGTQVAWGWEDNKDKLATRNVIGGSYGAWVYYLNSSNYNSYALPLTGGTLSGTLTFAQPVGLMFANGQQIKDNGNGGLVISSGAAININGTSVTMPSGITFSAPGGSILLKHAVSEVDAWIFQENAANWGLYYKNNPSGNHTFGGYTTVGAELFGMSAANISGNGVLTSNFVGATSAYAQYMLSNYTGYIWSASTIYAAGDMRAPEFRFTNSTNSGYLTGNGEWGMRLVTTDGFIQFGPANSSYAHIYTDRGTFYFNRDLLVNGNTVLTAANYNSYSPTLTGGNASGTWGISVTGNAATATTASNLAADTSTRFRMLKFTGEGGDSGNGAMPDSYAIYQQGGSWTHPYPDLCIGFHTGIKIGANSGYNGTRFYNDSNWATEIFSVGNGDNHVRVLNNLYVTGTVTGSNLSGTNTGDQTNISGNATTAGGLAVHANRNNEVNKIVRTDPNGYIQAGWINTTSGAFSSGINKIYCSDDDYMRYQTPANFISNLGLITTGNIGSQSVSTATNLSGLGTIQSTSVGTSYQNNYQVRENSGGSGSTNEIYAPQLAFHWAGIVASSIMMETSGRIAIRNNPGSSYENFIANVIYANSSFQGNLTGNVTGNVSGSAGSATTATNFNNGSAYSSGNSVYVDTLESISSGDWLELTYYGGVGVRIGTGVNGSKALYAGSLYDAGNRVYSAGNPQSSIAWSGVTSKPAGWLDTTNLIIDNAPDTAVPSGFYQSYTGAGNPTGTWMNYINVRHSNPGNGHGFQIGMSYYDTNLWFRSYQGGLSPSYSAWGYAISSLNIASQSVANATTVGGYAPSNFLGKNGNTYYQQDTWIQVNGTHGIYWPSYYGAHIYVNTSSSYTQLRFDGVKNGYDGVYLGSSAVNGMMYDTAGNGGVYREANGRWYWYHHVGNNCTGISTSSTSSSYRAYVGGALYAEGDIVAFSDVRKKTDIVTIDNALDKVINLRGVYYTRIDDPLRGRQTGVIAQEINEVLPEVVTYAADVDHYGVSYGNIVGVLIEAIKEQQIQIEELKAKLTCQ